MKKLLLIFVLSLMAIFAGCADDKDNNTDTETDIPENITYSFLVDSLSLIDKTDNTSEWRFLPYDDTDPLEAVFADMLGRPDNETDKIMCVSVLGVYEGEKERGPCYGSCGYYDGTIFRAYVYEKKTSYRCNDSGGALYEIYINNNISPYIYDYKILFSYIKEQILNNPYKNRYMEADTITVKK